MGGLRRISGFLMIAFGVVMVAWQLWGLVNGGGLSFSRGGGDGGAYFGAFVFPTGLILFGIQRLRIRRSAEYTEEVVCPVCNRKKAKGAPCPGCGS